MMQGKSKRGTSRATATLLMVIAATLFTGEACLSDEGFRVKQHQESRPWDLTGTIKQADVILACTNEISGGKLNCRIDRVLGQTRKLRFSIPEGEIFPDASIGVNPGVSYGEKSVIFLKKDQRTPWRTAYVHKGKVRAFGDMPLENLISFASEEMRE